MKFHVNTSDEIAGFLDQGTSVAGELKFSGTLRIDGAFHGSISTDDTLVIGEHAVVNADIRVGEIEIAGQVFGRIEAKRRVEVLASGRVSGDIRTPELAITPGALLDARTQMAPDPVKKTIQLPASVLKPGD